LEVEMRRRQLAGFVTVVVFVGAGSVAWRWAQRGPGRASVSDAISRFRSSPTAAAGAQPLVPRPGVYLYDGTGSESLSFMGTSQSQGPTEPGTIVLRPDNCWQFRIDFNSFHGQTWNRCSRSGKLLESGGTTDQRFDFGFFASREHTDVTCSPVIVVADPAAAPGTRSPIHCSGRSRTTKTTFEQVGVATYLGREAVSVGGVAVPGLHVQQDMHLSGGQTGSVHVDIWFASTNGLPLKEAHSIRVVSPAPAPINHVTYTERGTWQLTSEAPRT
jgi:hypothetical protein